MLGGFLGTTTSLSGIPPVLLLSQQKSDIEPFFADLAVYAIGSASIGLAVLTVTGRISLTAVSPAFMTWIPPALAANALGVLLAMRLAHERFRLLTLAVVIFAGLTTIAAAF